MAILAVMVNHYGPFVFFSHGGWQQRMLPIVQYGYLGVDLFFVLSGFLITGILVDSRRSSDYLQRFYWRRSLRIFPLYFFYLALVFGLIRHLRPEAFSGVNPLWFYSYLANWHMAKEMSNPYLAHLWSLCVEEQFYIVWPFIVLLFPPRKLLWFCGIVIVSALAFRLAIYGHVQDIYVYMLTPARMDALVSGALISLVVRRQDLTAWLTRYQWIIAGAAAVVWAFACHTRYEQTFGYSAAAVFFSIIIFWAVTKEPSALRVKPLRTLGKYSYGLYMYHVMFRDTIFHRLQHWLPGAPGKVLFAFLVFGATLGMALLSWHLLESPFLRLKDRYFQGKEAAA